MNDGMQIGWQGVVMSLHIEYTPFALQACSIVLLDFPFEAQIQRFNY